MHRKKFKNEMEQLDINKIMEEYKPDRKELASVLFPNNRYPEDAFERILRGVAKLDSEQIARLADYLGVFVHTLYTVDGSDWSGSVDNGCIKLTKGGHTARITAGRVSVYRDGHALGSFTLKSELTPFKEIVELLDSYINNQN